MKQIYVMYDTIICERLMPLQHHIPGYIIIFMKSLYRKKVITVMTAHFINDITLR